MKNREQLGRLVREVWIKYCCDTGDMKPSHLAPWEELSEGEKEVDRKIGEVLYFEGMNDYILDLFKESKGLN